MFSNDKRKQRNETLWEDRIVTSVNRNLGKRALRWYGHTERKDKITEECNVLVILSKKKKKKEEEGEDKEEED